MIPQRTLHRRVVRDRKRAFLLVVMAALLGIGATTVAASAGGLSGSATLLTAWCVLLAALCLVMARQRVVCWQDRIQLVYPLRTREIRLAEIASMRIDRIPNFLGERIPRPVAVLRDGTVVRLPGLQPFSFLGNDNEPFPLLPALASYCKVRLISVSPE